MDTTIRRSVAFSEKRLKYGLARQIANTLSPAAIVTGYKFSPARMDDFESDAKLTLKIEIPSFASFDSEGNMELTPLTLSRPVPSDRILENLEVKPFETRVRPMYFRCPKKLIFHEEIKLPTRFHSPPKEQVTESKTGKIVWKTYLKNATTLAVDHELGFSSRIAGSSDFSAYNELLRAVSRIEASIKLTKGGK